MPAPTETVPHASEFMCPPALSARVADAARKRHVAPETLLADAVGCYLARVPDGDAAGEGGDALPPGTSLADALGARLGFLHGVSVAPDGIAWSLHEPYRARVPAGEAGDDPYPHLSPDERAAEARVVAALRRRRDRVAIHADEMWG